jgi:hypothetical protein
LTGSSLFSGKTIKPLSRSDRPDRAIAEAVEIYPPPSVWARAAARIKINGKRI